MLANASLPTRYTFANIVSNNISCPICKCKIFRKNVEKVEKCALNWDLSPRINHNFSIFVDENAAFGIMFL